MYNFLVEELVEPWEETSCGTLSSADGGAAPRWSWVLLQLPQNYPSTIWWTPWTHNTFHNKRRYKLQKGYWTRDKACHHVALYFKQMRFLCHPPIWFQSCQKQYQLVSERCMWSLGTGSEKWSDYLPCWQWHLARNCYCHRKSPKSGSMYYNYKSFNSIVLMALVNANYKFLWNDVGGTDIQSVRIERILSRWIHLILSTCTVTK